MAGTTDIVDSFMGSYRDERGEWELLRERAVAVCTEGLQSIDVVGHVTSRVKADASLRKKLEKRHSIKEYASVQSIMDDQMDFVGLRIALFFPTQKSEVMQMLKEQFSCVSMRPFRRDWKPHDPGIYQKLFGKYVADHVWVCLDEKDRDHAGQHSGYRFEIQLRSVLMDAWAGISHDLEYKALAGHLTLTELKLIDAVKGQVEVGELVLDQLHRVHKRRIETEHEAIQTARDLEEVLLDSLPEGQISQHEMGDLHALLLVLKAINADTSHRFRGLLDRLDVKTGLRGHLEGWQRVFWPVPATFAYYIVEKLLPDIEKRTDGFSDLASIISRLQPNPWYNSPYWQPLIWLSRELLRHLETPEVSLSASQTRRYAHIWCAQFHRLSIQSLAQSGDSCMITCLSSTRDRSAPGIELVAKLCVLNMAPTDPEYTKEHDEGDGLDDRFAIIVNFLRRSFGADPGAWKQAIHDYTKTLVYAHDRLSTNKFLRSVDIALWLASLDEQDLLVRLLQNWPFGGRPNSSAAKQALEEDIRSAAMRHSNGKMLELLQGSSEGFCMLSNLETDSIHIP